MSQIWRIHLNTDSLKTIDPKKFCFDNNVVGIGWRAPVSGPFQTPEQYISAAAVWYKDSQSWKIAVNAFCYNVAIDDLIWARDNQGNYYLGKITGDWSYQDLPINLEADILNVRPCIWQKVGTADAVPGKVASSFFSRRTIQRVHDETVRLYSEFIISDQGRVLQESTLEERSYQNDIFSIMSPDDCEDLVGLYLQYDLDYLLVPSSCKISTLTYEYSLVNKATGKPAVVQVKLGSVDINFDDYASIETDIYLCTTQGHFLGQPKANQHIIEPKQLLDFLSRRTSILPAKIRNRLLLYQQLYK